MNVRQPPQTGRPTTDALIEGPAWDGTTLTFSFPTVSQYADYASGEPYDNFEAFSLAQQSAVRDILTSISTFTTLTFSEIVGSTAGGAVLRFGMTDDTVTAHAYLPTTLSRGGDAWFRNTGEAFDFPVRGNYAWYAIMHEIGHTLGLGHPHETGAEPPMSLERDWMAYTVMSYRSTQFGTADGYTNDEWGFAQTYMIEDIAALQVLYGANFDFRSGNDTYRWTDSGSMSVNYTAVFHPGNYTNGAFMTVWDGGGTDTYDFSHHTLNLSIDLAPGEWTTIAGTLADLGGDMPPGNIANALLFDGDLRSLIENAIGGSGEDEIRGNQANNLLDGRGGNDEIWGFAGDDTLLGGAGGDLLWGGAGNDSLFGGEDGDSLEGEAGNDTIDGGLGDDRLYGREGDDSLFGGEGDDTLVGGEGNNTLDGGAGNDVIEAGDQNDTILGDLGSDVVYGYGGNDTLTGGAGNDQLIGGVGADVFVYAAASDSTVAQEDWLSDFEHGTDKIDLRLILVTSVSYQALNAGTASESTRITINTPEGTTIVIRADGVVDDSDVLLGPSAPTPTPTPPANQTLTGTPGVDSLIGGAGHDRIDGLGSADALEGGLGHDTYVVDNTGDVVTEAADAGLDTVEATASFTLGANVENLILIGTTAIDATGNDLSNALTGNAAANRLDGGAGADAMAGRGGNDTYFVDHAGDIVTEAVAAGTDTVESAISFTLALYVENLTLTGDDPINGSGNAFANTILGNAAANRLDGGAGADTMAGGAGDDTYFVDVDSDQVSELADQGRDAVRSEVSYTLGAHLEKLTLTGSASVNGTGNGLNNFIVGNSGFNTLDGGTGADTMVGGAGSDTYIADNLGDRVSENASEGSDSVFSSVTFSLTAHVERLTLTGTGAINATGNALPNTITGNGAANLIDGGGEADALTGGAGNDIYILDNAGDVVSEQAGEGADLVKSTVTATLGANLERLTLRGSGAIDGTGNALANTIAGNEGANRLDGGAGADRLLGYGGNDVYIVDNVGDQVIEVSSGGGSDRVDSWVSFTLGDNIESLRLLGTAAIDGTGNDIANTLTGTLAPNRLDGGRGNDTLVGGGGDDTLIGGLGVDHLTGTDGADDFVFDKALSASNVDTVLDFERGSDAIVLENAVFKGIAAGAFTANALAIGSSAADADDRIVYDPTTGNLFYDADGSGGTTPILFATLDNTPALLGASDFVVT